MKKVLVLSILALATPLVACNGSKTKIYVYAAASLTETMEKIAENYEKDHDVKIVYNFDSSGTLKTQIENGADCDLFMSAAPKQMNQLQELGLIDTDSRIDLLENKVALVVPDGNPKNVTSIGDLITRLMNKESDFIFAMGNSDVPVGQYTQKIFQYYDIMDAGGHFQADIESHITYGSNVKEVASVVKNAGAACGTVYKTDAYSNNLTVVDTATKEMCGQVIYPAAIINNGKQHELAAEFLNYLCTPAAMEVFESVGFSSMVSA